MDFLNLLLHFLNPLKQDSCLYKSLSELMMVGLRVPSFSINNANNRGMSILSNSFHYKSIEKVGNLFIKDKIRLTSFILDYKAPTYISDATFIKRSGKKIYGAKKLKNYVTKSYEILQDILITITIYDGLSFVTDFKIINHNKKHLTKPEELAKAIESGKISKNSWHIIDGGLKSAKLLRAAREKSVKLVTRLNTNFVVSLFGEEYRLRDILSKLKPNKCNIKGENYIFYHLKRCIWNKVAGNLFLVQGEGYKDFIPVFTISLKSKTKTAIDKYLGRSSIEECNKELKSYLSIEGFYFRKKESNYGELFIRFMMFNFIQHLRLKLNNMSFKEVLDNIALYLLWKYPPNCVFEFEKLLNDSFVDTDF